MPGDVVRPVMGAIEKSLAKDDFESGLNTLNWAGLSIIEQNDGNHIGKIPSGQNVTYGLNRFWLSDHTVRFNALLEYSPGAWTEVVDIKYKNNSTKAKIMVVQPADKSTSRLILQTEGQGTNLWYTYNLPADHAAFTGKWFFMKVVVKGDNIKIYIDSEDNLAIDADGLTLTNAALAFKPWGSTMYIDNLMISRAKDLPETTVLPELDNTRLTLAYQDFESGNPAPESGFVGGNAENGAYTVNIPVTTGNILSDKYSLEFNIKAKYTDMAGGYSNKHCAINVGGYKFNLSSASDGSSAVVVDRMANGASDNSTISRTDGTGPKNHAEADDIWSYVKITRDGNKLEYYFNNKETPSYIFTDTQPLNGQTVTFDPCTLTSLAIDNVIVSAPAHTERVKVIATDGVSNISVASKYAESVPATIILAAFSDTVFEGLFTTDAMLNPSVNDGRGFATTTVAVNGVSAQATSVIAYVLDKGYSADCLTTVGASADDTHLALDITSENPITNDIMLVIVPEGSQITDAVYAKALTLDANGLCNESILLSGVIPEGNYTAVVFDGGSINGVEKPFQYLSSTNLAAFLVNLNAKSGNETDFVSLVATNDAETYMRYMGVTVNEFKAVADINWASVRIFAEAIKNGALYSEQNTGSVFNDAILTSMLANASSAAELKRIFDSFEAQVNPDADIKAIYNSNGIIEDEVFAGMFNNRQSFKNTSDIKNSYKEQVLLSHIYKSSYMNIYGIISQYASVLGIDITKLPTNESARNQIMMSLNSQRCYKYSDFVALYNNSIPRQQAPVTGGSGGGGGGGGSYTQKAPATPSQATVEATYGGELPQVEKKSFKDVTNKHWAYEYIGSLSTSGIIDGFADGGFYPENSVTRAQLCKIISLAFELEQSAEPSFEDVNEGDWYYNFVSMAKSAGIVNGDGNKFNPDENITRQDIAVMLFRILENKGITVEEEKEFADMNEVSEYAQTAVAKMAGAGIINGFDGDFEPTRFATRAEAAKIVFETLRLVKGGN